MPSPVCEQAIKDAQETGRALLKFISPNDVGLTGGHQFGYYLPKACWQVYTDFPPTKGTNNDHRVDVRWENGTLTNSTVKWYGTGTRAEYRLTGFNRIRDFPFLTHDCVGSLLVLVPERLDFFRAYVLDLEDEIEDLQAALGVEVVGQWALYEAGATAPPETENDCIARRFRAFTGALTSFPSTVAFATEAQDALLECVNAFIADQSDTQLMRCVEAEYTLFKLAERRLCEPEIVRVFATVDDFLRTAQTILQRRKSRAGSSLELHVARLLRQAAIPFDPGPTVEGTKPDMLIPGKREYLDPAFPDAKLFSVGIKTTCKDRWRQVLSESPRVRRKHLLTLQKGISPNQLDEMTRSAVTLVVPKSLHGDYPRDRRPDLMTVEAFIEQVRTALAAV